MSWWVAVCGNNVLVSECMEGRYGEGPRDLISLEWVNRLQYYIAAFSGPFSLSSGGVRYLVYIFIKD